MCEKISIIDSIIPDSDILLERAKKIVSHKVKQTLEYRNKKSNIKGISLISENPLIISVSQKKYGRNSKRIISKESFFSINELNSKIKNSLGNNYKNKERYKVKNEILLKVLKIFDAGDWSKVYILSEDGKKEVHYFKSENGLIYDFKTILYNS